MEKAKVIQLIQEGSDRVALRKNLAAKSKAWDSFSMVYIDGDFSQFITCSICKTVLKWKNRDGTSSLSGHADSCLKKTSTKNSLITSLPGFNIQKKAEPSLPASVKSSVADAMVIMCAKDIRPFSTVEGEGFEDFVQKIIDIGATYGRVEVKKILPCATTVSRHLSKVYNEESGKLVKRLGDISRLGITTDIWTHDNTNVSYITVTVHYLNDELILESYILATRRLDEAKTGEFIRRTVLEILKEFSCYRLHNAYVTDNAANMKLAFKEKTWISCSGHNLNLVLSHSLQSCKPSGDKIENGVPAEVVYLIDNCKQLITLAKRTNLNSLLETTLKNSVVTRWNSVFLALKSIQQNLVHLRQLVTDNTINKNIIHNILEIDEGLLVDTMNVLEIFDSATRLLSADKTPTLHLVIPTKYKILKQLKPASTDSAVISTLKDRLVQEVQQCFVISDLHRAATLLDPRLKNNAEVVPAPDKLESITIVRNLMQELSSDISNSAETSDSLFFSQSDNLPSTSLQPITKRARVDPASEFLTELFTSANSEDEVEGYLAQSSSVDVLEFWQQNKSLFPQLYRVVKFIFSIPATSTSSERAFSLSGRTLEDRRTNLLPENVDKLLFLHGSIS